jgi:hypothetical protein
MASTHGATDHTEGTPTIALVGGGPAALVAAIALARRGIRTSVFERDTHPEIAPRFNPDRSYTIDISGHGLKALRHIDACSSFDDRMIRFKGLKIPGGGTKEWTLPGWRFTRRHPTGADGCLGGEVSCMGDVGVREPRHVGRRRRRRPELRYQVRRHNETLRSDHWRRRSGVRCPQGHARAIATLHGRDQIVSQLLHDD